MHNLIKVAVYMQKSRYQKLSFVIPVYNEEKTLETLLNLILSADLGIQKELIIINDCSTDRTGEILKKFSDNPIIKIVANDVNMGKSISVKRGIGMTSGDLVVVQDADLEYDPQDLKKFVDIFNTQSVDIVYGNRFAKRNEVLYWHVWLGNMFLSFVSALITGIRAGMWIRDAHVCYKMVKGDIMRDLGRKITSTSGFGFDTEISARLSKVKINGKHLKLAQVPVSYTPRTMGDGKKLRPVTDGLKALWEILKYNF